jgi:hypothetical protein
MNEENMKKLEEAYPKILGDVYLGVGDGWYALLDRLCKSLQWDTDKNGYPQVIAQQIKEKFGGLRFYYTTEGDATPREHGIVEGKISFAEKMSYGICEYCGKPGETRDGGWIKVECDECHNKGDDE